WLNDTWEWDGTQWTQRTPASSPSARSDHAMAFDESRGRVVLFGGGFGILNDTWEWDGSTWLQRSPPAAPPPRARQALAYDSTRAQALLFGGQSNGPNYASLYSYGPVAPATVTSFGSGCAGSAGVPVLAAAAGPWLGETFTMTVSPIPGGNAVQVWF